MQHAIQRTELKTYYYTPVHCPFCGTRVMGADPQDETRITACPHTLFIAHDMAFESRSQRLDENLNFNGLSDQQVEERWLADAGLVTTGSAELVPSPQVKTALCGSGTPASVNVTETTTGWVAMLTGSTGAVMSVITGAALRISTSDVPMLQAPCSSHTCR